MSEPRRVIDATTPTEMEEQLAEIALDARQSVQDRIAAAQRLVLLAMDKAWRQPPNDEPAA